MWFSYITRWQNEFNVLFNIQVVNDVVYITATKAECEYKQDELDDSDESGQEEGFNLIEKKRRYLAMWLMK